MAKRKRDVPVLFWVSAEELELIHQKMQQYGIDTPFAEGGTGMKILKFAIRDRVYG